MYFFWLDSLKFGKVPLERKIIYSWDVCQLNHYGES